MNKNGSIEPGLGGMADGIPPRMVGRLLWGTESEGVPRITETAVFVVCGSITGRNPGGQQPRQSRIMWLSCLGRWQQRTGGAQGSEIIFTMI